LAANAAVNLWRMMASGLGEKARAVFNRTHFGVVSTKIDPPKPGMGNGTCTHDARFKRDEKIAIDEAF
jgi:hypothetical protein